MGKRLCMQDLIQEKNEKTDLEKGLQEGEEIFEINKNYIITAYKDKERLFIPQYNKEGKYEGVVISNFPIDLKNFEKIKKQFPKLK